MLQFVFPHRSIGSNPSNKKTCTIGARKQTEGANTHTYNVKPNLSERKTQRLIPHTCNLPSDWRILRAPLHPFCNPAACSNNRSSTTCTPSTTLPSVTLRDGIIARRCSHPSHWCNSISMCLHRQNPHTACQNNVAQDQAFLHGIQQSSHFFLSIRVTCIHQMPLFNSTMFYFSTNLNRANRRGEIHIET